MRHPLAESKIMPKDHGACMDVTEEHAGIRCDEEYAAQGGEQDEVRNPAREGR
jgi:hypothetical protein